MVHSSGFCAGVQAAPKPFRGGFDAVRAGSGWPSRKCVIASSEFVHMLTTCGVESAPRRAAQREVVLARAIDAVPRLASRTEVLLELLARSHSAISRSVGITAGCACRQTRATSSRSQARASSAFPNRLAITSQILRYPASSPI